MIEHLYEVHFLFPEDYRGVQVPFPTLRIPEIPFSGDRDSFEEVSMENGNFVEFIVVSRYFHLRDGIISIATVTLSLGDADGVKIEKTN